MGIWARSSCLGHLHIGQILVTTTDGTFLRHLPFAEGSLAVSDPREPPPKWSCQGLGYPRSPNTPGQLDNLGFGCFLSIWDLTVHTSESKPSSRNRAVDEVPSFTDYWIAEILKPPLLYGLQMLWTLIYIDWYQGCFIHACCAWDVKWPLTTHRVLLSPHAQHIWSWNHPGIIPWQHLHCSW